MLIFYFLGVSVTKKTLTLTLNMEDRTPPRLSSGLKISTESFFLNFWFLIRFTSFTHTWFSPKFVVLPKNLNNPQKFPFTGLKNLNVFKRFGWSIIVYADEQQKHFCGKTEISDKIIKDLRPVYRCEDLIWSSGIISV